MTLVRERLASVLSDPRTASNVRAYFGDGAPGSTYSGRLFERFGGGGDRDGHADRIAADDLVAVESLSVQVPPETAYALLHGPAGDEVETLLRQVPRDIDLGSPDAREHVADGSPADRAWRLLDEQPGVGWVTAGKLLARKRPKLLPVYDDVVRCVLGAPSGAWLALDTALADSETNQLVEQLRPAAPDHVSALRVVDVALWMRHHEAHRRGDCADFGAA